MIERIRRLLSKPATDREIVRAMAAFREGRYVYMRKKSPLHMEHLVYAAGLVFEEHHFMTGQAYYPLARRATHKEMARYGARSF